MKFLLRLSLLVILITLTACVSPNQPDLARLYQSNLVDQSEHKYAPIVFIHGVFGARLNHSASQQEVWPGSLTDILFSPYDDLALKINPATLSPQPSQYEATAINDAAAGQDFYGNIIQTLTQAGGYELTSAGTAIQDSKRRLYLLVYDWRQDNVKTVQKLDRLIEQIRRDHQQPNLKVNIVAHSMGGLIARYYTRYGSSDVLNNNNFKTNAQGAQKIHKMIVIGTPNLGSVSSLHEFIQGFKVGLNRIPTEVLATMPSAFQLFPHPIRNYMITLNGQPLERDIFDVNIWRSFQWSIFDPDVRQRIKESFANQQAGTRYLATLERYFEKHLERARRFVWSLSVKIPAVKIPAIKTPSGKIPAAKNSRGKNKFIVFGGDCELTPSRLLIEEVDGVSVLRLSPEDIQAPLKNINYHKLMLEPGDGRVTKPSLFARDTLDPTVARHKYSFFPMAYSILLCESHDQLTGNINFQNNLLNILLSRD
ncbi:MAG: hypothetical protein V7785_14265 [Bermanella sp.]